MTSVLVRSNVPFAVRALTLVDTRTGDFQQLSPYPWTRVLSSDIKMYENGNVLPRASLFLMRGSSLRTMQVRNARSVSCAIRPFDPAEQVIISTSTPVELGGYGAPSQYGAEITAYSDVDISISVNAADRRLTSFSPTPTTPAGQRPSTGSQLPSSALM